MPQHFHHLWRWMSERFLMISMLGFWIVDAVWFAFQSSFGEGIHPCARWFDTCTFSTSLGVEGYNSINFTTSPSANESRWTKPALYNSFMSRERVLCFMIPGWE
ncbi:hypothetical protein BD779DRAFT_1545921 [Infundibulicybe gibba]|nr:hypothetical protein BD779DRAFT_1545921 [Infundibulicybe gibba]